MRRPLKIIEKELFEIINRSANILEVKIVDKAAMELASRSRGTPRIANRILRRARDFAEVKGKGEITIDLAKKQMKGFGGPIPNLPPIMKGFGCLLYKSPSPRD